MRSVLPPRQKVRKAHSSQRSSNGHSRISSACVQSRFLTALQSRGIARGPLKKTNAMLEYMTRPVTSTRVATNGAEEAAGSNTKHLKRNGNSEPVIALHRAEPAVVTEHRPEKSHRNGLLRRRSVGPTDTPSPPRDRRSRGGIPNNRDELLAYWISRRQRILQTWVLPCNISTRIPRPSFFPEAACLRKRPVLVCVCQSQLFEWGMVPSAETRHNR